MSFAKKNHGLKSYVNFLSLPVKERFRKAASKGLCFRCLESGHRAEVCQKPPCKYCQGRHHSLLHQDSARPHFEEVKVESVPKLPSSSSRPPVSLVMANSVAVSSVGKVILQTVPAILCGSNGFSKVVRCFLDPGSQTSHVRQSVIDELSLDGRVLKLQFLDLVERPPRALCGRELCLLWNLLTNFNSLNVLRHLLHQ